MGLVELHYFVLGECDLEAFELHLLAWHFGQHYFFLGSEIPGMLLTSREGFSSSGETTKYYPDFFNGLVVRLCTGETLSVVMVFASVSCVASEPTLLDKIFN